MSKWIILVTLVVAVFLAGGCLHSDDPRDLDDGDDDGGSLADDDGPDGKKSGLHRFLTCDELLEWFQSVVLTYYDRLADENLEWTLESWNGGGWWDDDGWWGDDDDDDWNGGDDDASDDDFAGDDDDGGDDAADDDDGPPQDGDDEGSADDDDDHSDTNVQEEGVDEADIVKTDGELLYVLAGGNLLIFDPVPAPDTTELSRLAIAGRVLEMFLYGDLVVVFSDASWQDIDGGLWPGRDTQDISFPVLVVTIVDAEDPTAPEVMRTMLLEGGYISSRRVANMMRLVASTWGQFPYLETWIDPTPYVGDDGEIDEDALRAAYDDLKEKNRDEIEGYPLDTWLPEYYESGPDGEREGALSECTDYYRTQSPFGTAVTSVVTVDLENPADKLPDIALIANGALVYASTESLYVSAAADAYFAWDWEGDWDQRSEIHKFLIGDERAQAEYVGSGIVPGYLLNQFSMGEKDGYLRAATTTGSWGDSLSNGVYVLAEGELETLDVVGSVDGIAPGETLQSARFMGDRGFLVTFEQTDPLFTLDLSDPTDPRVVGELEIPGFSTYLHPFGDDHLLTIGVGGNNSGQTGGVLLQIFDVTDFANPAQAFTEQIGEGWSVSSEAQYDHKAFLYYPPMDLLAIPITDYAYDDWWGDDDGWWGDDDDWTGDDDEVPPSGKAAPDNDEPYTGVYVYNVTVEDGFEYLGRVDHTDLEPEGGWPWEGFMPSVRRTVIIGEYMYTISNAALVVTRISSFADVATSAFPYEEDDYWWGDDDWEDGGGWDE
ncbi:beta-propeller domain-containing protein [bacterium]|nr:beta-propeller domain-containing protein [bacterium]